MPAQPSCKAVAILALVCLSLAVVGASIPPAAAQSDASYVSVTNVTHSPETPTTGEPFEVEAVVENHAGDGGPFTVNEVLVTGQGVDRYVADDIGKLPAGASTAVTLPVTIDEPGQHVFTVVVYGTDPSGNPIRIQHPVTVQVVDRTDPQLELSAPQAVPGATRPVNVTVGNGRDTAVRQVAVAVSSPDVAFEVEERVRAEIPARNTTTFQFPATVDQVGRHPIDVRLSYTANGVRQHVNRTFEASFGAPANPGEIALTGTEAVVRGGNLELSATASNVGTTEVEGVVVAIGDAPGVGSADYFVGSVEGSDFSSFTLTTSVSGNVSSVPVRVRYLVDGVERTYTTEISVEQVPVRRDVQPQRGGPPIVPIVAGIGAIVVLGAVYRWRG